MKAVIFAYHDMGCVGLNALLNAGFVIVAVFTHADAAGENHFHGSVAQTAQAQNIPVYMPEDVNQAQWVELLTELAPDMLFSLSFRQILSRDILACARVGAFGVQASLLPAHRGRAHLNWVLIKARRRTFTIWCAALPVPGRVLTARRRGNVLWSGTAVAARINATLSRAQ